jgi:hypothetical protein
MTTDERRAETASKFNVLTGIERNGAEMDKATLTALQGSIAKWEGIVAGTKADEGADNCPLCDLFNTEDYDGIEDACKGCPVQKSVGVGFCMQTPYYSYRHLRTTEAAQAELDFLRSLLPASLIAEERQKS